MHSLQPKPLVTSTTGDTPFHEQATSTMSKSPQQTEPLREWDPEATSGEELLARLDNDGSTEESQPMTTVRADALPDLKEYTLIAFLDIEGAFNNVLPIAITESLTELGVESPMVGLIHKLLISRMVTATLRIQPRLD